jgi:hypothetical protein
MRANRLYEAGRKAQDDALLCSKLRRPPRPPPSTSRPFACRPTAIAWPTRSQGHRTLAAEFGKVVEGKSRIRFELHVH